MSDAIIWRVWSQPPSASAGQGYHVADRWRHRLGLRVEAEPAAAQFTDPR